MPDSSTVVFFAGLSVVVLAAKYFLSAADPTGGSAPAAPGAPRPVTEDMISVVSVLVPHIDREVIRQDLEETHSVQETSTRLLNRSSQEKKASGTKAGANSLMSRYNVDEQEAGASTSSQQGGQSEPTGWIDDRKRREEHIVRQRQQMILKARQRTLELEQQKQQEQQ